MRLKLFCLAGIVLAACAGPPDEAPAPKSQAPEIKIVPDIEQRLAKFSPTPLEADLSALSAEDRRVLGMLVQAARLMDEIFLRQAWTGNPALRDQVAELERRARRGRRASTSTLNFGPWDRLEERQAVHRRQAPSARERATTRRT